MKGIVTRFNDAKGFGNIKVTGADHVFVHHTDIDADHVVRPQDYGINQLMAGDEVEFDFEDTVRGPRAKNVRVTKAMPSKDEP